MRGDSLSIVVEHMLEGWLQLDSGDELHLVVGPDPQANIPEGVIIHQMKFGRQAFLSRMHAQSVKIPRLCRSLDADIMLGMLPTTTITPLPCPRAIMIYDLRYKLRPEGFTRKSRFLRNHSYRLGFRQFDAAVCISERTKRDLLRFYPRLWKRPLRTAHLGADHVDTWPVNRPETPYAIAFSHYANKNVDLVIDAWALRHQLGELSLPLALVGVSGAERPRILERIADLGLVGFVNVFPWMPIETFRETFASSSLVVFPSDFEGFGLPAAEAMRLGIPVVITPDLALLEVTDGHATVMEGETAEALVRAVNVAKRATPDELEAARRHADRFTWRNFAFGTRWLLAETVAGVAAPAPRPRRAVRQPVPVFAGAGASAGASTRARRSLVPAFFRRNTETRHPGSFRWLGAALAGTLAISGISAASIALVSSNKAPAGHGATATSTTSSTHNAHRSAPGFVQLPAPTQSSSTSTTPNGASTSISGQVNSQSPTSIVPKVTVPPVTVPQVTIPTVSIPPLPLTSLPCSVGTTASTSPVSLPVQPCNVTTGVNVCRCP
jgi:glycosyltransferase involved in cell wall biosynthesis